MQWNFGYPIPLVQLLLSTSFVYRIQIIHAIHQTIECVWVFSSVLHTFLPIKLLYSIFYSQHSPRWRFLCQSFHSDFFSLPTFSLSISHSLPLFLFVARIASISHYNCFCCFTIILVFRSLGRTIQKINCHDILCRFYWNWNWNNTYAE